MGTGAGAGLLAGLVTPRGPTLEQFVENCLVGGTPRWSRGSVLSPPPADKGQQRQRDELASSPFPCAAGGKEVRQIGSEIKPRKEGGGGRCVSKIWVYFSLTCSDLTGNKLISPS